MDKYLFSEESEALIKRIVSKSYLSELLFIRMTIERYGLSVVEFCSYLNLSESTYYRYEKRQTKISERRFLLFLAFLNKYRMDQHIKPTQEEMEMFARVKP